MPDTERLVRELTRNKRECEWLEVKRNEDFPEMIAKNISALSNGAALFDREYGYMIWGVDDKTFEIVGTGFEPLTKKKGNQDLSLWLRRMVSDHIDFNFEMVQLPEGKVILLTIGKAVKIPTEFDGVAYVRVNNSTTNLDGVRQIKKKLIDKLEGGVFETKIAKYDLVSADILTLLNHSSFFRLNETDNSDRNRRNHTGHGR
ncbi:MAG: ATP-binding protein [Methanomassiliicoccaceae archaeon]|nr:ATP-binding protein [Methanomassiliicoccaceae archaeon]